MLLSILSVVVQKIVDANSVCPRDAARPNKNLKVLNVKDSSRILQCVFVNIGKIYLTTTHCFLNGGDF